MHTNPDVLALLALGETPEQADGHLSGCAVCRAELAELVRVVEVGHTVTEDDALEAPPARVWQAIKDELDGRSAPTPVAAVRRARRGLTRRVVVLVAVLTLIAGFGLGLVVPRLTAPTPALRATMNALPLWAGSTGEASVQTEDGRRYLVVRVQPAEPVTGQLEVWMSDSKAQNMRAMGDLNGDEGRFLIPADVDLEANPVIDVSLEPAGDSDPAHSGVSVLRCRLPV